MKEKRTYHSRTCSRVRNRSIRNQQGSLQGTGADTAGREQSDGRTGAYDRYGRNCAGAGRDGKHREKNRFGHRSRNG